MTQNLNSAPLLAHLAELRRRFLYVLIFWAVALVVGYYSAPWAITMLVTPLLEAGATHLIYTQLTEAFITRLHLTMALAAMVALPFMFIQVWLFIAPGLYARERQPVRALLVASPCLFMVGMWLAYAGVMPLAWEFLLSFQLGDSSLPLRLEARVSDYLHLTLTFMLAFGIAFQLPILLACLALAGVVKTAWLRTGRRYAVLILLIVAAILTPPDVVSQLLLFVPLYILYEASIAMVAWLEQRRLADNADARYKEL